MSFFLGSMTNFTSICTLVSQEHKYQTILTCTQLESIYFMRGMTFFNSTVFIGYGSHVDNKLEPYTVSSITLWKNSSFRKVFGLRPCFIKNSKKEQSSPCVCLQVMVKSHLNLEILLVFSYGNMNYLFIHIEPVASSDGRE